LRILLHHPARIYQWKVLALESGSVEDWVSQARTLQSSGDLFAELGWVAEGLAVHPHDPKLLQIQDEIQRDQGSRRRQNRRRDLENLRRMELEIDEAGGGAAKQALAERVQALAARYWTDGEILSIANALLQRLGLAPQAISKPSPHSKAAAVIFHVPRHSAPQSSRADSGQVPPSKVPASKVRASEVPATGVPPSPVLTAQVPPPNQVSPSPVLSTQRPPSPIAANATTTGNAPTAIVPPSKVPLRITPRGKLRTSLPKTPPPPHNNPLSPASSLS
jgi:hypothetical protein